MKALALSWTPEAGWVPPEGSSIAPSLVLCFAERRLLQDERTGLRADLAGLFPGVPCVWCSSAGEIFGCSVTTGAAVALLLQFESTRVLCVCRQVPGGEDAVAVGESLARELWSPDLRHVLVFSDGLQVNGARLAAGLRSSLPRGVAVTGGMAADGDRFEHTLVGLDAELGAGRVVGVSLCGQSLRVAMGSAGGWAPFGPKRLITRSEGNVLYTLDNQPALALYKRYLGERAAGLPATGLLFPLQLLPAVGSDQGLVRTILAVDEGTQSLTFAGDMPEGCFTRLMKAGGDALVEGAGLAAAQGRGEALPRDAAALLVSCVGRKLVLGQRVEEEVERVQQTLGSGLTTAGFYSYGELCPSSQGADCELHNQTMTLTVFSEDP